jgi:hypothetical protein
MHEKSVVIFISGGYQRDKQCVKSLQSNGRQTPSDCNTVQEKQLSQNILKTIAPDAVRVQKSKVYMYKKKYTLVHRGL